MPFDDSRVCPACGGSRWEELLHVRTGRIMTGDQRIVPGDLHKIRCADCGVTANARVLSDADLDHLYGDEYILNTQGREEHRFYTASGPVPRSQVFFDWLAPHLPAGARTLLEIGCGEGNVLTRFAAACPGCRVLGLDGSHHACRLARDKGLEVSRGLVPGKSPLPRADVIVAINVLEHAETLGAFLGAIRDALSDQGRVLFTLPIQDYPGYDLFFAEHVWHFTLEQCRALLARHGLEPVVVEGEHPINHGIGLFVCRKAQPREQAPQRDTHAVTRNRDTWTRRFAAVDAWLAANPGRRVALFGASEVATLLLAFTSLGDRDPVACIDEDPTRVGTRKHGIDVVAPGWLAGGGADAVILAANPKYHAQIEKKLQEFPVGIYSFTKEEER